MHRKVAALVAAAVGVAACGPAWAGWPDDKPIEVVIGFAPGGGTDVMARKLLPFVEQRLGGKAKFVVLNKPGAGGEIAFAAIARAAPDAYSIGVVNVPGYNFIPMTRKTQYSMDEIRLIARVVDDPSVIVVPAESKFATLADVLAALRSKPGSVTFGHNGAGTNGHLAIRMLANAGKVEPNEISYRGTAAQRTDLLGGHLEVGMVSLSEVPELHGTNKGQLRAIAILSKRRFPSAARRSDGGGNRHPGHDDSGTRLRRTQGRFGRGSQKARGCNRGWPARSRIHQELARRRPRSRFHARR
jgi:tripartite-type tricarboxylate transporter receptor subunit TctC